MEQHQCKINDSTCPYHESNINLSSKCKVSPQNGGTEGACYKQLITENGGYWGDGHCIPEIETILHTQRKSTLKQFFKNIL